MSAINTVHITKTATPPGDAKPRTTRKARTRPRRGRPLVHLVVVAFMLVWFTPVLGLFVGSVRTTSDSASTGWWHAFTAPLFTGYNYQQAMAIIGIGPSLGTSLAIAVPTTVLTTVLSAVGAFALTRMAFKGRTIISLALVALMVTPPQVTLVPMLKFFSATGLIGTVPALWIYEVGFTIPFGIFLVRGFIASIPGELFESASIDGASRLRTFLSIVLPLSVPVLASLAIMQFLWAWNDLLSPLLFLGGSSVPQPLTVNVAGLVSNTGGSQAQLMAAAVVSILIPLIILVSMQRFFVRGILGGSVKG